MSTELGKDEQQYEWGVEHNQGRRVERTEAAAREALIWLLESHERNTRKTLRPRLVRRAVGPWEEAPGER